MELIEGGRWSREVSYRYTDVIEGSPADVVRIHHRRVKQVVVINKGTEPPMQRGKEIAQGAHASGAFAAEILRRLIRFPGVVPELTLPEAAWIAGSFVKVVLQAPDAQALRDLHEKALAADLKSYLITDAGKTVFRGVPTVTALGIGPDWDDLIDSVTGGLRLY